MMTMMMVKKKKISTHIKTKETSKMCSNSLAIMFYRWKGKLADERKYYTRDMIYDVFFIVRR